MNSRRICLIVLVVASWISTDRSNAAEVSASLSTRETYLGETIVLQVEVTNAEDHEEPELPSIDGLDIRSLGSPMQSSQIIINNGRRLESSTVVWRWGVTPRTSGTFQIPAINVKIGGREFATEALSFVVSKSEAGDLLFVEIVGDKDSVYVGEPLLLTLKIWIKPYRDSQHRITLSEADMWSLVSEKSSWGQFDQAIAEMAQNRQRPGGREVLRDDGQGDQRGYYLYEVDTTFYPTRRGTIDGSDVQVVVNYPTKLKRRRDPFGSLFDDDFFSQSPMSGLLDDAFGNRAPVAETRPISAEASVDDTQVLAIPLQGRPDDYRGTVGRYEIKTRATPTHVQVGDEITLEIDITGTGPMERLQAPPLELNPDLNRDFKVPNQSLAGVVRDQSKRFTTTLRPKHEDIRSIPPIRLSFYNPETQAFETATSEAIAIQVSPSDTISINSVTASALPAKPNVPEASSAVNDVAGQLGIFANDHSNDLLVNQPIAAGRIPTWVWIVVAPATAWLAIFVAVLVQYGLRWLQRQRPSRRRTLAEIVRATTGQAIVDSAGRYLAGDVPVDQCSGALRRAGDYTRAAQWESLVAYSQQDAFVETSPLRLEKLRQMAERLVDSKLNSGMTKRDIPTATQSHVSLTQTIAWIVLSLSLSYSMPHRAHAMTEALIGQSNKSDLQSILNEAKTAFETGQQLQGTEPTQGRKYFETAAANYQAVIDSGVQNSHLYQNLANTNLQLNDLGHAIANLERARRIEPENREILARLTEAENRLPRATNKSSLTTLDDWLARVHRTSSRTFTLFTVVLGISSVCFWGFASMRTLGLRWISWHWIWLSLILMITSITWFATGRKVLNDDAGVLVADEVTLRAGDDKAFAQVAVIPQAQGMRVRILTQRAHWVRIRTVDNVEGWTSRDSVASMQPTTIPRGLN